MKKHISKLKIPMQVKHLISIGGNALIRQLAVQGVDVPSNLIINSAIYKVNIDPVLPILSDGIDKCFTHLNSIVHNKVTFDGRETKFRPSLDSSLGMVIDATVYKGSPIILVIANNNNQSGHGVISDRLQSTAYFATINTPNHIKTLHEFIDRLLVISDNENDLVRDPLTMVVSFNGKNTPPLLAVRDKPLKTFSDVFINKEQLQTITDHIDAFKQKRRWFYDNKISSHFGIILYGEPSTGKSSIAQAISSYLNSDTYMVSGDDIMELPALLSSMSNYGRNGRYRCIIVEDIDCGVTDRRNENKDNNDKDNKKSGLASLLNSLDGYAAPNDVVFIFTTNHIQKLDPALIRPGRIDLKLEIKYATEETLNEFIKYHYGEDACLPAGYRIKSNVSFATLQTLVMIDKTCDEIIEYCKQ
jgi:hypothetical protein